MLLTAELGVLLWQASQNALVIYYDSGALRPMGAVKMLGSPAPPPFLERILGTKAPYIRVQDEPLNTGKTGPGRRIYWRAQ